MGAGAPGPRATLHPVPTRPARGSAPARPETVRIQTFQPPTGRGSHGPPAPQHRSTAGGERPAAQPTALTCPPGRPGWRGGRGRKCLPAAGRHGRRAGGSDAREADPRRSPPQRGSRGPAESRPPRDNLRPAEGALLGAAVPRATSRGTEGGLRPSGPGSSVPAPRRKGRATTQRHLRGRVSSSRALLTPPPWHSSRGPNHRPAPLGGILT